MYAAFQCMQVSLPTQYNNKNQEPVGALSGALSRLQASKPLRELREVAKSVTKQLPGEVQTMTAKVGLGALPPSSACTQHPLSPSASCAPPVCSMLACSIGSTHIHTG